jgi:2-oxoisovalerate dehydrogenase E1 component alpha subunit
MALPATLDRPPSAPPGAEDWADLLPAPVLVQLLDEDGGRRDRPGFPIDLDARRLLALHRAMVFARRVDRQAINLTRQGLLGVYPSGQGQEATEVGAVFALDDGDWLFPTYRETEAMVARGLDPLEVLQGFRGTAHCAFDPHRHRVAAPATPIATQTLHAAGLAMAARLRGDDLAVLAFCGDGATSEGDFHEALNFASVYSAPCVFLICNNQYAISVPLARQTHAPTLAHKAIGYGMPGVRVDGNDVLAVYAAVRRGLGRARSGAGPTLVEALTYRTEAHTNADDQTRYRNAEEVARWAARDPVRRFERYLEGDGLLDAAARDVVHAQADEAAMTLRDRVAALAAPEPAELLRHVYADPTPALIAQQASLEDELARGL